MDLYVLGEGTEVKTYDCTDGTNPGYTPGTAHGSYFTRIDMVAYYTITGMHLSPLDLRGTSSFDKDSLITIELPYAWQL